MCLGVEKIGKLERVWIVYVSFYIVITSVYIIEVLCMYKYDILFFLVLVSFFCYRLYNFKSKFFCFIDFFLSYGYVDV